jgi:hypothetical protein
LSSWYTIGHRITDVTDFGGWPFCLGHTVSSVRLHWPIPYAPTALAPYPRGITISFAGGTAVFLSAAQYDAATDNFYLMKDTVTIAFEAEIAQRYRIGPYAPVSDPARRRTTHLQRMRLNLPLPGLSHRSSHARHRLPDRSTLARMRHYRQYLCEIVYDICVATEWRRRLFDTVAGTKLRLDAGTLVNTRLSRRAVLEQHRLISYVSKVPANAPCDPKQWPDHDEWCESGAVMLRFESAEFPIIYTFAYTNPQVI